MAIVTQQDLINAGFVQIVASGRWTIWAGPDTRPGVPAGSASLVGWDSTTGRRKYLNNGEWQDIFRVALGTAVVLGDLIAAIPNAVIPGATRAQMGADLLAALKDD